VQRHRRAGLSNSHHERRGTSEQELLHPKKVGTLPVAASDELKRTHEIKTAIPLLDAIDIQNKDITADALLTQRPFADDLVQKRNAHYHFTVKNNQPGRSSAVAGHQPRPPVHRKQLPRNPRLELYKFYPSLRAVPWLRLPQSLSWLNGFGLELKFK
jgi:hypothetical protein